MTDRELVQPTSSSLLINSSPPASYSSRPKSGKFFLLPNGKKLYSIEGDDDLDDIVLNYTDSSSSDGECSCCTLLKFTDDSSDRTPVPVLLDDRSTTQSLCVWGLIFFMFMISGISGGIA